MTAPVEPAVSAPHLERRLSLWDATLLCVGGIIGSAIFLVPRDVARQLPSAPLILAVWIVGGGVSLVACFAAAELGAMFPEAGGTYVYLREAYGDFVAFLFGWMAFTVYNAGALAALAVAFASYFGLLVPAASSAHVLLDLGWLRVTRADLVALAINALLTAINVWGVKRAAFVLNVAAWMKYLAMGAFVLLGFAIGRGSFAHFHPTSIGGVSQGALLSAFGVALVSVFWAYDGWVYVGWAAGEIRNPQQNVPRALLVGIVMVAVIYVAMNAAYLYAIPATGIAAGEETTARAAAVTLFSPAMGGWISALIAVSCFGALAAAVLSSARVYYAMARDGLFFRRMANVHPRYHTPAFALVAQAIWASVLMLSGRYDQLVTYLIFMGVLGYILTVGAVFVLRRKLPDKPRPYRCTGYPAAPAIYCAIAVLWALNTLWQRPRESLAGLVIVLLGVPAYLYWRRKLAKAAA